MSIERLQAKIRKTKNPIVLDFDMSPELLPPCLLAEEGSFLKAHCRLIFDLLEEFRGFIPAVKFQFSGFALQGVDGLTMLSKILDRAKNYGYYVILEVPEALSAQRAAMNAQLLFRDENPLYFDGLLLSAYIGSDGIKPYASVLEETGKSLFVAVRTGNRSASEIQDLLTGGRNVYDAMADVVNRFKASGSIKSGYDRIAIVAPATSASIARSLREKYKNLFILVDGYDYPNANAKNCAEAADKLGHGIVVCGGTRITAAWQEFGGDGKEYLSCARDYAQRMQKHCG